MIAVKHRVIGAGLRGLAMTAAHRAMAPLTRGRGAILTLHHVRPWAGDRFAPNRGLEVTPGFLDQALRAIERLGYRIVALGDVPALLADEMKAAPFVALTFDDGYRDLVEHALPVLERHRAPFTAFVTTGFLDRTARLWWLELEALLRVAPSLDLTIDGYPTSFALNGDSARQRAFNRIAGHLLRRDDGGVMAAVLDLCRRHRVSGHDLVDRLCLDWAGLGALADHPLATIGSHTQSHARLAGLTPAAAERELTRSQAKLASRLQRSIDHLCYPYGSPYAAGAREFRLAAKLGFATAVTTRPGVLFQEHHANLTALPRISLNGFYQTTAALEVLLSGAPFAIRRSGRRLDVD